MQPTSRYQDFLTAEDEACQGAPSDPDLLEFPLARPTAAGARPATGSAGMRLGAGGRHRLKSAQRCARDLDVSPFNADHSYRLALARARIEAGEVDEDDFDEEREGWTSEQVGEAANRLLPLSPDPVVTHGDFSLDNLLMLDGQIVGCIDVGRVGVADRYQDLAILWNCLGEFDASLQERLFAQYGIAHADQRKLQFHVLLDELF